MSQLRIFIADPNRSSRLALQMLLDHEPGMQVVGIAVQLEGLLEQITAVHPDVILIDWQLIVPDPEEHISDLHRHTSQCHIIVLDIRSETEEKALDSGADAFVGKNVPPDRLLQILRKLNQKEVKRNSK